MEEIWKKVVGFENEYEVSNKGRIKSRHGYHKELVPTADRGGYLYVSLRGQLGWKKKRAFVHSLVLETFKGAPPEEGLECCHNDGDCTNNCLENLRWGTHKENSCDKIQHGTSGKGKEGLVGEKNGRAKISDTDVVKIRQLYSTGEVTQKELAEKYGMDRTCISDIVTGRSWKHVPI